MTKEKLNKIIKLKKEVEQLREKLQDTQYSNSDDIVSDKVKGSMSHYPFSARSFNISGYEGMSESCIKKRDEIGKKISNKYDELYTSINDALDYINTIEDSEVRQIMIYKYIDGLTWEQTGDAMNYAAITVRKKHDDHFKSISPNITLEAI